VDAERNDIITLRRHIISIKLALWMQKRIIIFKLNLAQTKYWFCQISLVDANNNCNFTRRRHIISVKLALWMQKRITILHADDR